MTARFNKTSTGNSHGFKSVKSSGLIGRGIGLIADRHALGGIRLFSTVTERGQTTVPAPVRKALSAGPADKLAWHIGEGQITVTAVRDEEHEDPALEPFLALLEHDIAAHPERLISLDPDLFESISKLTKDVEVDLDAPLTDD